MCTLNFSIKVYLLQIKFYLWSEEKYFRRKFCFKYLYLYLPTSRVLNKYWQIIIKILLIVTMVTKFRLFCHWGNDFVYVLAPRIISLIFYGFCWFFKMNQGQPQSASKNQTPPGFCSATCIDRTSLQQEISKPELKTSDMFATCNLPKRFEHPRKCLIIFTIKYFFILPNYY